MRYKKTFVLLALVFLSGCQGTKATHIGEYNCDDNLKLEIEKDESTLTIGKTEYSGELKDVDDTTKTVDFDGIGEIFFDISSEGEVRIQKQKNGETIYVCKVKKADK